MRVILNPLKGIQSIRRYLQVRRQLQQTRQILKSLITPAHAKELHDMSATEYYDFLTSTDDLKPTSQNYYQFVLDYLVTGYLHGELNDLDVTKILGLNNPLQLNRYVDRMIRDAHMKGSFIEELMQHSLQDQTEPSPLYSMLFSPTEYDAETGSFLVKSFEDVKKVLETHQQTLQVQKKQLAIARMHLEEKQRQDAIRQAIAVNNPEAMELVSNDAFISEDQSVEHDARVVYDELKKQQRGTLIRAAQEQQHKVVSPDIQDLSPAEQIAYKKKLLAKVRGDQPQQGMNIRI